VREEEMKAEQIRAYFAEVISKIKSDEEAYIVRTKEIRGYFAEVKTEFNAKVDAYAKAYAVTAEVYAVKAK
jgi:hypothetical protein